MIGTDGGLRAARSSLFPVIKSKLKRTCFISEDALNFRPSVAGHEREAIQNIAMPLRIIAAVTESVRGSTCAKCIFRRTCHSP